MLALHKGLVSAAVVRAVHARGAAVLTWTVNDPALVGPLAAAGVDAIGSDDPSGVAEARERPVAQGVFRTAGYTVRRS